MLFADADLGANFHDRFHGCLAGDLDICFDGCHMVVLLNSGCRGWIDVIYRNSAACYDYMRLAKACPGA